MNDIPRVCCNLTNVSRSCCGRARLSSFAEIGCRSQYPLPLLVLPSTKFSPAHNDFRVPALLSNTPYQQRQNMRYPLFWQTTAISQIMDMNWHVTNQSLPLQPEVYSSTYLQSSSDNQNPEPEKPKWEEEQYPDIGKSIPSTYTPNLS